LEFQNLGSADDKPEGESDVELNVSPKAPAVAEFATPAPVVEAPVVEVEPKRERAPDEPFDPGQHVDKRGQNRIQHEVVRVRGDLIENLINSAGEVSIYRSRLEQQVNTIGFNLAELDQTVVRLREQLRRLEMETEAQILSQ